MTKKSLSQVRRFLKRTLSLSCLLQFFLTLLNAQLLTFLFSYLSRSSVRCRKTGELVVGGEGDKIKVGGRAEVAERERARHRKDHSIHFQTHSQFTGIRMDWQARYTNPHSPLPILHPTTPLTFDGIVFWYVSVCERVCVCVSSRRPM